MVRARRDRIQAAAKDGVMRNRGAHQWEDSCSTDGVALGEEIRNDAMRGQIRRSPSPTS